MSGRTAKRLRREGKRLTKVLPPRSAKFEPSTENFAFDKELYADRRKHGLRGMVRPAAVVQTIFDPKTNEVVGILPVSGRRPPKSVRYSAGYIPKQAAPSAAQAPLDLQKMTGQARSSGRGD